MCHSILEEMNKVRACEQERKVTIPKPNYLFVQKYGRSPEDEMPEIAKNFGNGNWFSFYPERKKDGVSVTNYFIGELEKYAELATAYQGHILVELTGEEEPKDLFEFLSYIKQKGKQFQCIFTTRMLERAEEIKHCLDQHFFVREIGGKAYDSLEQCEIFLRVLREYGFCVEQITGEIENLFDDIKWEETDMVQNCIENTARNIAYNKMLAQEAPLNVAIEEVKDAMREWKKEPETERRIGFV